MTPDPVFYPARIQALASLVTWFAASELNAKNPENVPTMVLARKAICDLSTRTNVSIYDVSGILQGIGLKELKSKEATLMLEGIPLLVDVLTGKTVSLDVPANAQAAARGVCEGMMLAEPWTTNAALRLKLRGSIQQYLEEREQATRRGRPQPPR